MASFRLSSGGGAAGGTHGNGRGRPPEHPPLQGIHRLREKGVLPHRRRHETPGVLLDNILKTLDVVGDYVYYDSDEQYEEDWE